MASALPCLRWLQALVLGLLLVLPHASHADDVVGKVTQLNKKALEAYDNLEFDEAKRLLNQAIEQSAGIEKHPMRARSYVHMGVVLIAGFKQKDEGTRMFCEALKISPEMKLTKSLANPELQEAFDSAAATCGKGGGAGASSSELTITHQPVTRIARGVAATITATVSGEGRYDKLVLFYRGQGTSEFTEKEMSRGLNDTFRAEIPATETAKASVSYYIAAQTADGLPVATKGSAFDPLTITPGAGDARVGKAVPGKGGATAAAPFNGPRFVLGLAAGTGFGYVSGASPEVNSPFPGSDGSAKVSGVHLASLLQIAPELGYLMSPSLMLSVQGRIQMITGGMKVADVPGGASGCPEGTVDGVSLPLCDTAKWAVAVLAKLTYYMSTPEAKLRPFVGFALGGGYVRNAVTLNQKNADGTYVYGGCVSGGTTAGTVCKDTVRIGPVLAGPLAGLMFNATKNLGFALTLQMLAGLPDFGVQLDVNGGLVLKL